MAATPQLRDRLSFLHRLPLLLKGTSDDDTPCPGFLFEEIAKISHESLGSSQCLLEYLLSRLHSGSGRVKLKVLKILLHLCGHGSSASLLILRRNPAFIQEAAAARGGPSDLLTDALPLAGGQAFLQPLSSALFSSRGTAVPATALDGCSPPVPGDAREAEARLAASREQGSGSEWDPTGLDTPTGAPGLGPGPRLGHDSLFAGMELVACPRLVGAGAAEEEPLPAPWTASQRPAAQEPSGSEPSAFAFLNV